MSPFQRMNSYKSSPTIKKLMSRTMGFMSTSYLIEFGEEYRAMSAANAGTIVTDKTAVPKLLATPNSAILTPCFMKLRSVVASSGTKLPTATMSPVRSPLIR